MDNERAIAELLTAIEDAKDTLRRTRNYKSVDPAQRQALKDKIKMMEGILREETKYRRDFSTLQMKYNVEMQKYNLIERLEQELKNPARTAESLKVLIEELSDFSDSRLTADTLFNDVELGKLKLELKAEIEQLAFEQNKLNGVVDDRVLQRDKHELDKIESFIEGQRLTEELHQKLLDLETLLVELDSLYDRVLTESSPELSNQIAELEGKVKTLGIDITKLIGLLNGKFHKNINLNCDFNTPAMIDIDNIRNSAENLKNELKPEKIDELKEQEEKIYSKYGILPDSIGTQEYGSDRKAEINGLIDQKVARIRQNYIPQRVQRSRRNDRNNIPDNSFGYPDARQSAPDNTFGAPAQPGASSQLSNSRTPGNSMSAPLAGMRVTPLAGTRVTPGMKPQSSITGATQEHSNCQPRENTLSAPSEPQANRSRSSLITEFERLAIRNDVLSRGPVPYNLKEVVEARGGPQESKIEDGKLYRFVKVEDELLYVAEDIEQFLDNPGKSLKSELRDLRTRMIETVGGERQLARLCESMRDANRGEDTMFTRIVSSNPIERALAIREFAKEMKDTDPLMEVQMLLALKSAVLPSQVDEAMERTRSPYKYKSDLLESVILEDNKILKFKGPKVKHVEAPTLIEMYSAKGTDIRDAQDGVIRPFEITDEAIGRSGNESQQRQPRESQQRQSRDSQQRQPRDSKNDSQDGSRQNSQTRMQQGKRNDRTNSGDKSHKRDGKSRNEHSNGGSRPRNQQQGNDAPPVSPSRPNSSLEPPTPPTPPTPQIPPVPPRTLDSSNIRRRRRPSKDKDENSR